MTAATRRWAVALGVALALDAAAWVATPAPPPPLPELPGFDPADARSLQLGEVVVTRVGDGWEVDGVAADPDRVALALAGLAGGVRATARLGDLDAGAVGLDGAAARVVVRGAAGPLVSLALGADVPGSRETFVRWDGPAGVLRADVGGRARYPTEPGALRDRRLLALAPAQIRAIAVTAGGRTIRAERRGDGFAGPGADGPALTALAAALCAARGEVRSAEGAPAAEVALDTDAGPVAVAVLRDPAGTRLVVDGVAREVREPWVARLAEPDAFADRAAWQVVPRRFGLAGEGLDVEVVAGPDGWRVVRPAGLAVDPARLAAAAALLSAPRVARWGAAPPPTPGHAWWVEGDAGRRTLALGPPGPEGVPVADPETGRAGWLDAGIAAKMEGIFRR